MQSMITIVLESKDGVGDCVLGRGAHEEAKALLSAWLSRGEIVRMYSTDDNEVRAHLSDGPA